MRAHLHLSGQLWLRGHVSDAWNIFNQRLWLATPKFLISDFDLLLQSLVEAPRRRLTSGDGRDNCVLRGNLSTRSASARHRSGPVFFRKLKPRLTESESLASVWRNQSNERKTEQLSQRFRIWAERALPWSAYQSIVVQELYKAAFKCSRIQSSVGPSAESDDGVQVNLMRLRAKTRSNLDLGQSGECFESYRRSVKPETHWIFTLWLSLAHWLT